MPRIREFYSNKKLFSSICAYFFCNKKIGGNFGFLIKGEPEDGRTTRKHIYRQGQCIIGRKESLPTGRAMKKLIVSMIFAKSPQAKGRVEGPNRTLQDRLV